MQKCIDTLNFAKYNNGIVNKEGDNDKPTQRKRGNKMEEIKKAYQKMGKELRKLGYDVLVSMSSRQMQLGTATIELGIANDYEYRLHHAEQMAADNAGIEKEATKAELHDRKMYQTYKQWAADDNINFRSTWQEIVEAIDSNTIHEYAYKNEKKMRDVYVSDAKKYIEDFGSMEEQQQKLKALYLELIHTMPVMQFMSKYNATAELEIKDEIKYHAQDYHLRFRY